LFGLQPVHDPSFNFGQLPCETRGCCVWYNRYTVPAQNSEMDARINADSSQWTRMLWTVCAPQEESVQKEACCDSFTRLSDYAVDYECQVQMDINMYGACEWVGGVSSRDRTASWTEGGRVVYRWRAGGKRCGECGERRGGCREETVVARGDGGGTGDGIENGNTGDAPRRDA
jgi:hypothetical protein